MLGEERRSSCQHFGTVSVGTSRGPVGTTLGGGHCGRSSIRSVRPPPLTQCPSAKGPG